jgi:glutamate-1-semialdehyde 2,1-aminomutase
MFEFTFSKREDSMSNSRRLFSEAKQLLPGGVNSPVRSFSKVGGQPLFIKKAKGAFLFDEDNNKFIDYIGSWGPMILGHAHESVISSVKAAVDSGLSYGAPTQIETSLAKKVKEFFPSMELIRMVSSGTEATMSAVRLARGFTKRDLIVKFEGCYHGHADSLLVKAGSGALTFGEPDSLGVPQDLAEKTIVLEFNNIEEARELFKQKGEAIAAVIVEPIAGNMGCVPPIKGFLEALRLLCDEYASVLIFDEVMTGFRVSPGGAQQLYDIKPDLTTLGKILGGGLPVGGFGGKRELMQELSPMGGIYQAGTLSGNPITMHAGLATLSMLENNQVYEKLEKSASTLTEGLETLARETGVPFKTNRVGSMFGIFFTKNQRVETYNDALTGNNIFFVNFFKEMLQRGVYLAPSPFEAGFLSTQHDSEIISTTLYAAKEAFQRVSKE